MATRLSARRSALAIAVGAVLAALLLTGCAGPAASGAPSSGGSSSATPTADSSTGTAALSCPQPSDVKVDGGSLGWVRCFDLDSWLIGGLDTGSDGVSVVHQTAPGTFTVVTQGSSFSDAAMLEKGGVPADLVALLTHPGGQDLRTGLSCPNPAQVSVGASLTWIRCFDGNSTLIGGGVYNTGAPADGLSIVTQTAAGRFTLVTQGSSFDNAANLQQLGLPADLITLLTHPGSEDLYQNARTDYTFKDFAGTWTSHESSLVIKANGTGSVLLGSGASDSVSFPMTFAFQADGIVQGKVSGAATYTGTGSRSVKAAVGTLFWVSFAQGATGPVLLSTNLAEPGQDAVVWCGGHSDPRCGA